MIAYDRLSQIIPPDQALANKALQVSLQQIKNISKLTLPGLASAFKFADTTKDLPLINALAEPVPANVVAYYTTDYATGSGPNGQLRITDVIGAAAGAGYTQPITNCVSIINSLTTAGTLSTLITVYQRMQNTVDGIYGDPVAGPVVVPAGPGAGTYSDAATALDSGLIPAAQTAIAAVQAAKPTETTQLNTEFDNMAEKLISENANQTLAQINISNLLTSDRNSTDFFALALPEYGVDVAENGAAWYLEQVADLTTLGGQAIVGCLRQGRNAVIFQTVGVGQDTKIPDVPTETPPTATLLPSSYSATEAANLIVK
jgi:hypothetical protein